MIFYANFTSFPHLIPYIYTTMCGFVALLDFNKNSQLESLQSMTRTLHHRGPDGEGFEMFQKDNYCLGMGHKRLSILDLSAAGKQPMHLHDLHIIFNGEIYNFEEINEELKGLGHNFYSHSDTETILHAYKEWGTDCLKKFIGMFAFVIFDEGRNQIFGARDRAGVKPFFIYENEGLFLFASELKAFHKHPNFKKEIDTNALAAFMQYGNIPSPHSIFKNVYKLGAGEYFTMNLESREKIQKKYWNIYDYYNQPKKDISFQQAKEETKELLSSAFQYRMRSDVPVGIFLSGGYDSAAVTSILQANNTQQLKTFTIGVPDIGLNEAPFAKDVAQKLGTDHHEFQCTAHEALELIHKLPYHYDEPFADSSALPTMLVSKMASEQVTVALSADGGDEIFAGYNRYDYLLKLLPKLEKVPNFAGKSMAAIMDKIPSNAIPVLKNKYNFHNRYEKMKGILRNPDATSIMLSLSQQFTNKQVEDLMLHDVKELDTFYLSKELQPDFFTPLAYMQAIDYNTYMLDDILTKVDRATMFASIEGREPLLDHRIAEYAAQLPDDFKYHKGTKKYILREIVHDYLPKEMMERPKQGFAIPIAEWMWKELKEHVNHYISEEKIAQQGFFKWKVIQKMKRDFYAGKKELDFKMWYLLMFQMWYEEWMVAK